MAFSGNTYTLPAGANTATVGGVVQSAVWNNIHNDLATALNTVMWQPIKATGVNFNSANTDTAITIVYPPGFTRFRVSGVVITHASASISTATAGVFTAAAGGGVAVVTGGSAITITASADNTVNNMMLMTVNNQNIQSYNVATLYFRVGTAQGSAATADVSLLLNFFA